jgi:hypothetical protein
MRILLAALLLSTAVVGCNQQEPWAEALSQPDESLIEYRRPALQAHSVRTTGKDSLLLEKVRSWAEGHQAALTALARAAASDSTADIDRWDCLGSFDDGGEGFLISLFGAYGRPKLMAGCKALLSFDRARTLRKVYVFEEPLE